MGIHSLPAKYPNSWALVPVTIKKVLKKILNPLWARTSREVTCHTAGNCDLHIFVHIYTQIEREREREPIESNRVVDFCSLGELETGACSTGATSAKSPCNVHNSQITSTTHNLCLVIKELLFTVLFSNKIRCTIFL